MPLVIVGTALDLAGFQLQLWLSAIQCLDMRFFVNRQHQRVIRRIQVQANDIENLLSKVWIVAYTLSDKHLPEKGKLSGAALYHNSRHGAR